jgi:hypothetical protein
MHLLPGVAKQPNLELKTWHKQLLGSLPLVIALPDLTLRKHFHPCLMYVEKAWCYTWAKKDHPNSQKAKHV